MYGCCVSPPHLHTEGKSDNFNLRLSEQGTKRATQNGRDFHYGSCRVCDDGGGGRREGEAGKTEVRYRALATTPSKIPLNFEKAPVEEDLDWIKNQTVC